MSVYIWMVLYVCFLCGREVKEGRGVSQREQTTDSSMESMRKIMCEIDPEVLALALIILLTRAINESRLFLCY